MKCLFFLLMFPLLAEDAAKPNALDAANDRIAWLEQKVAATEDMLRANALQVQACSATYQADIKLADLAKKEPKAPARPAALATPVQPQSSVAGQPKESDAKK